MVSCAGEVLWNSRSSSRCRFLTCGGLARGRWLPAHMCADGRSVFVEPAVGQRVIEHGRESLRPLRIVAQPAAELIFETLDMKPGMGAVEQAPLLQYRAQVEIAGVGEYDDRQSGEVGGIVESHFWSAEGVDSEVHDRFSSTRSAARTAHSWIN